jgi:hypothetical protein
MLPKEQLQQGTSHSQHPHLKGIGRVFLRSTMQQSNDHHSRLSSVHSGQVPPSQAVEDIETIGPRATGFGRSLTGDLPSHWNLGCPDRFSPVALLTPFVSTAAPDHMVSAAKVQATNCRRCSGFCCTVSANTAESPKHRMRIHAAPLGKNSARSVTSPLRYQERTI